MTDTTRYAADLSAARANLDRVIARAGLSLAHRDAILGYVADALFAATNLARAEMRERDALTEDERAEAEANGIEVEADDAGGYVATCDLEPFARWTGATRAEATRKALAALRLEAEIIEGIDENGFNSRA